MGELGRNFETDLMVLTMRPETLFLFNKKTKTANPRIQNPKIKKLKNLKIPKNPKNRNGSDGADDEA